MFSSGIVTFKDCRPTLIGDAEAGNALLGGAFNIAGLVGPNYSVLGNWSKFNRRTYTVEIKISSFYNFASFFGFHEFLFLRGQALVRRSVRLFGGMIRYFNMNRTFGNRRMERQTIAFCFVASRTIRCLLYQTRNRLALSLTSETITDMIDAKAPRTLGFLSGVGGPTF